MTDNDRLSEYEKKRNLHDSPEPLETGRARSDGPVFVIQQHDASSHHYDLRIEVDGVLGSWAVPKGPSTEAESVVSGRDIDTIADESGE